MSISLENSSFASYSLSILPNGGGVEQNPQEWWDAMCKTTRQLVSHNPETCAQIAGGISFCAQAQSVVLLDQAARAVRPSMSYMDQRSGGVRKAHAGGVVPPKSLVLVWDSFYRAFITQVSLLAATRTRSGSTFG